MASVTITVQTKVVGVLACLLLLGLVVHRTARRNSLTLDNLDSFSDSTGPTPVYQQKRAPVPVTLMQEEALYPGIPTPKEGCPDFVFGRNVSAARKGPKVFLSTGAYSNIVDGVSKSLNHLVADLQARDFQVIVLGPVLEVPAMEHNGLLYPAPSLSLPGRPEYAVATGLDSCTEHILEQFQPDIVQVATPDVLGYQVQRWAISHNVPVACSYHTRFNSYLRYYLGDGTLLGPVDYSLWKWFGIFYGGCTHTYPPTHSVSEEMIAHGVTGTEYLIWPRGIDLSLFNPNKRSNELRAQWIGKDRRKDTLVLLTVCRLVWEKNLQSVINTITELNKRNEDFVAVIVGDGPAKPALQEQLAEYGNVVLLGFLDGEDLSAAFASSDLFFFPSLTETWGAVTLEAMASGLPAIVANAPGSRELVQNGKSGFLIDADKPHRWANAIAELIHSPPLLATLRQTTLDRVSHSGELTWKHATDMIVEHYQELLKGKSG
eukprot:m.361392 g.361392  ORF g.361392 m.361392 type:complete len:489 (+) comp19575_c0_seq1:195-1661(+)